MDCDPGHCFEPSPTSTSYYCVSDRKCQRFLKHWDSPSGIPEWTDVKSDLCFNQCRNYEDGSFTNCDSECDYYCDSSIFTSKKVYEDLYLDRNDQEYIITTYPEFISYKDEAVHSEWCPLDTCKVKHSNALDFAHYRESDQAFYIDRSLITTGDIFSVENVKIVCSYISSAGFSQRSDGFNINIHPCYGPDNTNFEVTVAMTQVYFEVEKFSHSEADEANLWRFGSRDTFTYESYFTVNHPTTCPF